MQACVHAPGQGGLQRRENDEHRRLEDGCYIQRVFIGLLVQEQLDDVSESKLADIIKSIRPAMPQQIDKYSELTAHKSHANKV